MVDDGLADYLNPVCRVSNGVSGGKRYVLMIFEQIKN